MAVSELVSTVHASAEAIRARCDLEPRIAIILGTGLGGLAEEIEPTATVSYADIPGFPDPTVESHSGRLVLGRLKGTPVVAMQGRFHRYEGYSLQQVTLPVRVLRTLGAETLVVSNVSGSMNPLWRAGELVLIHDHINLLGDSPLIGANADELGPRFPDMSEPYDRDLQELAMATAADLRIRLQRGVYVAVPGPALETRAEYRMLRSLGADVVGMSTVPEVIVARHMGVKVLGLSIVTDECLPDALEPVDVTKIIEVASRAEPDLTRLVARIVEQL
jgi:purine-nucleoside phosphorylase